MPYTCARDLLQERSQCVSRQLLANGNRQSAALCEHPQAEQVYLNILRLAYGDDNVRAAVPPVREAFKDAVGYNKIAAAAGDPRRVLLRGQTALQPQSVQSFQTVLVVSYNKVAPVTGNRFLARSKRSCEVKRAGRYMIHCVELQSCVMPQCLIWLHLVLRVFPRWAGHLRKCWVFLVCGLRTRG